MRRVVSAARGGPGGAGKCAKRNCVGGGAKRRRRHYIAPSRPRLETPDQSTADPRQDQQVPAVAADRPNGGFWSADDRKTTTYNQLIGFLFHDTVSEKFCVPGTRFRREVCTRNAVSERGVYQKRGFGEILCTRNAVSERGVYQKRGFGEIGRILCTETVFRRSGGRAEDLRNRVSSTWNPDSEGEHNFSETVFLVHGTQIRRSSRRSPKSCFWYMDQKPVGGDFSETVFLVHGTQIRRPSRRSPKSCFWYMDQKPVSGRVNLAPALRGGAVQATVRVASL